MKYPFARSTLGLAIAAATQSAWAQQQPPTQQELSKVVVLGRQDQSSQALDASSTNAGIY